MLNLATLYEDDEILVLDKPVNVTVNNSQTSGEDTVQNFISLKENNDENDDDTSEFYDRGGVVHRLDKQTSGVLITAKTPQAFKFLQKQFKERQVEKCYVAVVYGHMGDNIAEVNAPIGRNPNNRLKYAIVKNGRDATTLIKPAGFFIGRDGEKYTLVNVYPKTGRTHQIRVHLAALEHPIAGDDIYASSKVYDLTFKEFGRLMLHASSIKFINPKDKKTIEIKSPLPPEFSSCFTLAGLS